MPKVTFRTTTDGNGRVRFFVDGGEHSMDEYIVKYFRETGAMPDVPIGLGGRAEPEPVEESTVEDRIDALQAQMDELRGQGREAEFEGQGSGKEQ